MRAGYKVAVCDQLEDPRLTKKTVKRGSTELVTPGVSYNDELLSNSENNYLASVYFSKDKAGIAFLDISTGSFKVATGDLKYIDFLLSSLNPKEILLNFSTKSLTRRPIVLPKNLPNMCVRFSVKNIQLPKSV